MFVVELPQDRYGNLAFFSVMHPGPRVIEVEADPADDLGYLVVAPEDFPWRLLNRWGWLEVPGPARVLSDAEYVQLLRENGASPEQIARAHRRLGEDT